MRHQVEHRQAAGKKGGTQDDQRGLEDEELSREVDLENDEFDDEEFDDDEDTEERSF